MSSDDSDLLEKEAKYTKQALIVAIEAKEKKKQMFSPKGNDENSEIGRSMSRFRNTQALSMSKDSKFMTSSSDFRSRTIKGTSPVDLSLSALTKELEMRRKQLQSRGEDVSALSEIETNMNSC